EAAEKATPGPWEMDQENIWFTDAEGYTKHLIYVQQGDDVDDKQDHYNTAFIAAANPATMLALLDDLEAAEKRNVELSMLLEGADAIQTDYAEALECQDDNDSVLAAIVALKQRAESAEKRIADYHRALNNLAAVARRYLPDYDEHPDIQAADDLLESAAGIKWEAE
ncbi:ead/Ea22-like family protein, partial [Citrobacter farmeri]